MKTVQKLISGAKDELTIITVLNFTKMPIYLQLLTKVRHLLVIY